MLLKDIRDYIASLGIAEDEHCYCGKMDGKKAESIGVYPLKQLSLLNIPVGGLENKSYGEKAISILIHWNKDSAETEERAMALQEALNGSFEFEINSNRIKFIAVAYEEPISVGTDDNGIYEYVIECLVYYERKVNT